MFEMNIADIDAPISVDLTAHEVTQLLSLLRVPEKDIGELNSRTLFDLLDFCGRFDVDKAIKAPLRKANIKQTSSATFWPFPCHASRINEEELGQSILTHLSYRMKPLFVGTEIWEDFGLMPLPWQRAILTLILNPKHAVLALSTHCDISKLDSFHSPDGSLYGGPTTLNLESGRFDS